MKIFRHITVFSLAMLVFSVNVMAQKKFKEDADRAFDNGEFFKAIQMYKKAYKSEKDNKEKARIIFQQAECFRKIHDTKQAETWYQKAIKAKYDQINPETILFLADALKINEKYDEALAQYKKYADKVPSDPRGKDGVKSCEQAAEWKNDPTRHKVENMAMVNSQAYDFGLSFGNKKYTHLIFTSTRESATGGVDPNTGQTFSDLFESKMDKNGMWSTPTPLSGEINTTHNEGSATMNNKGTEIFFTRCESEKKKVLNCQIYVAKKRGNSYSGLELLDFNVDTFSFGQPTISQDGKYLIFTSDKQPGGFGGKDLWISEYDKSKRKWKEPENLGPEINTAGDEMFPHLRPDGNLYFSSSGHIGMGGLDIFKSESTGEKKWGNVENLKYPLNSAADDFGIIYEGDKDKGYFTSNREGGKGMDDIYSFRLPPLIFKISGTVTDCNNKVPIKAAIVKLIGSDGTSVETRTDDKGNYNFEVKENGDRYVQPNTSYVIKVVQDKQTWSKTITKRGYLNGEKDVKVTTVGLTEPTNFEHNFCLIPIDDYIRMPLVLYEFDKADLMVDPSKNINSKDSLNFLYNILVNNPTITVELGSHTDSRGNDKYNQKLSQRRAQSCVDYIVKEKGIDAARITAKGYGESRLKFSDKEIAKQKTEEEQDALHQANRRTEFSVLSWDYVPKGGVKQ